MPRPAETSRPWGSWLVVVALCALVSGFFALVGLPSPVLFGSLVAGIGYALVTRRELYVPAVGFRIGQGLIGVTIGALVSVPTLRTLAADWWSILAVTVGTLLLSVIAGMLLRLTRGVSAATGAFAMVAGGASGITAIARELGADDRVVTVVQYLRVVIVLLAMPIVTVVVFAPQSSAAAGPAAADSANGVGIVFTALSIVVGFGLARLTHLPAGYLLGPLVVAVLVTVSGVVGAVEVPGWLSNLGYALIGIQVGLRFTRDSLRSIARMLPLATLLIVAVVAGSAGLGYLLALATGATQLEAYLATTPGGIYAVLATAADSGADVTFVLAVQVVRLLVMLLAAPLLARALTRWS